jgi:hypothetical protein
MDESLVNRRELLTGGVIAALGALWLPWKAEAATTPPPGTEGATVVFDVACLGNTFGPNMQAVLDAKGGDLRGGSWFVEGLIYPAGTIPAGDGFDPALVPATGHWFCRGAFMINPARPLPHGVTTQDFQFGDITAAQLSAPDQLVASGVEGGGTVTRAVIGGTGRYRGVTGEMIEQVIGTNKTLLNDGFGPAPNFRFYVTL